MARTISELVHKEAVKQSRTELLFRSLEARSQSPPSRKHSHSPPQRLIKPFSSLVHMREPGKLRRSVEKQPLTYQQQLLALQEQTVPPPEATLAEARKVYGSRRIKMPGAKMSTRRTGHVKTYAERLQELKPPQLQVIVVPRYFIISIYFNAANCNCFA